MNKTPEQPAELNAEDLDLAVGGALGDGSVSNARLEEHKKMGPAGAREEDKKTLIAPGVTNSRPA